MTRTKATLIGLTAPFLWGMSVGLIRGLSELLGAFGGVAVMNTAATVLLAAFFGIPRLAHFKPIYLVTGVGSATLCEVCFAYSLAISDGGQQTIEVGMVNYLWPCLIILFAILFNGQKARWWIAAGFALALSGVVTVMSGGGFDPAAFLAHLEANPASYLIALLGAILWAAYCSFTKAFSNGANPVVIIYALNSAVFWLLWLAGAAGPMHWSVDGCLYALASAAVMGGAYACWTVGVVHGSITLLAIASYFTPVLSCIFSSFWLHAPLTGGFWAGVAMVVAGSLVCWLATRGQPRC